MENETGLLRILESRQDQILANVSVKLVGEKGELFAGKREDELATLCWTYLDPIMQSLRYENDYLYTFFIDFAGRRNATEGHPIGDMQKILGLLEKEAWQAVVGNAPGEELAAQLKRLGDLFSKGRDAIADIYLRQRDQLLSELRKSNRRLLDTTRRKLDFLAKVSHELKTPLTSVIAYSEQLCTADIPEELRQEFSQVISDQSHKLLQLIEDLLDFSKSENEQSRLNLSRAQLREVLEEAISTVQARAREKGVQLILESSDNLPPIRMDSFRIQQVVWNLLTNGVKYNQPGGEVMVSAERRGDEVIVSIQDDGIGIAPDEQDHIFTRFHQSDEAVAMLEGGAGLGLDLARHYVNLHGGEIKVESKYGKGSTFSFSLPIDGPPDSPEESDRTSNGEKILGPAKSRREEQREARRRRAQRFQR